MKSNEIELIQDAKNALAVLSNVIDLAERGWCHGAIEEELTEDEEQPLTLADVRRELAELARAGHTENIRMLLKKYGADRLSELDAKHYAAILADAREMQHAA